MEAGKVLGEVFSDLLACYGQDGAMEVNAIWLSKKIAIERNGTEVKTCRIMQGDAVNFKDGYLQPTGDPSHKIIGCYGDLYNTYLSIMVVPLAGQVDVNVIRLK